jgi:hypothetical protein
VSYKQAMKHWRNPRKHKMTAARRRGNELVFGKMTTDMTKQERELHENGKRKSGRPEGG